MIRESSTAIPGWYGKLPSLGDFARRQLPDAFIHPWDLWLQEVLHATRASMGGTWQERYLTMPIWRFVLLPGLMGPNGWAGVLMPSVDRVGRQFPLTLAAALPLHASAHAVFRGAAWFATLEEVALGALDRTCGPDDLDRALSECAFVFPSEEVFSAAGGGLQRLPVIETFEELAETKAVLAWSGQAGWKGLWWSRGRADGEPLMLACGGLPTATEFGWLVESRDVPSPATGVAEQTKAADV